jgi:hypothetical protein
MNPFNRAPRRARQPQLGAESLEPRELLTGGAGNTFAIIPGTITSAGGSASVSFTIDPAHFTLPHGKLALGIDVAPDPSGTLKPLISSAEGPGGTPIPQLFHSIYDPHLSHRQVANGRGTSAVLTPIKLPANSAGQPVNYSVQVTAESHTSGKFLLGFYLPGDADGDGKVDKTDLATVRSELGANANSTRYNFNADANRDGRIGKIDVAYTLQNQGVSTTISPVIAANLDPASVTQPATRSTNKPTAHFTGSASPGATVSYTNTSDPKGTITKAQVDPAGNYVITTPLVPGSNVFQVKSTDAFGQTISGTIDTVKYNPTIK